MSWCTYWKSITEFKNEFIAHRLIGYKNPVPYLDNALNIALEYDIWIRKIMEPDIFESPTLKESYNNNSNSIDETLNISLKLKER